MSAETSAPIWEQYDDWEVDFEATQTRGKGGGGGKRKKQRKSNSKTSQAARAADIEHSREERKADALKGILAVIQNFPESKGKPEEDKFLETYVDWVRAGLSDPKTNICQKGDLKFHFSRSGKHAGGQNVNKVNSQAHCRHLPTNLSVANDETRDQNLNRANAAKIMQENLQAHLDNWRTYLVGADENLDLTCLTSEFLLDLLLENA